MVNASFRKQARLGVSLQAQDIFISPIVTLVNTSQRLNFNCELKAFRF